jgi:hypothetical protein
MGRTDIQVRSDVEQAKQSAEKAKEKLADREAALGTLDTFSGMKVGDRIEYWSIYDLLTLSSNTQSNAPSRAMAEPRRPGAFLFAA